ncbi:MAG: amino acid ABC transporter permease [Gaiellaceae bacterium]
MATQIDALEPLPLPEGPPERRLPPRQWIRENLFGSVFDSVLTVVFGLFLAWAVYRIGKFVFVDADWEIVERNLTTLMVGSFPRGELWRVWAALVVLAASLGFGAGAVGAQRRREVAEGRAEPAPKGVAVRRLAPVVVLVTVLLWFSGSLENLVLVLAIAGVGAVFNVVGRRTPRRLERFVPLLVLAGVLVAFLIIVALGGIKWNDWGGFMLTIFLAVGGILMSFPVGVLLALGRRSSLPAVRIVCTAYIEMIRGVPLVALLFMGVFMLGFFLPEGIERPDTVVRVLIALVMFTSAYVAEIVRGGLQSVPAEQVEAAQALGLSSYRTIRQIVLPQALRSVIPGLVGQFISLYKDTSLVFVVGLADLLTISENITKQPDFLAQGLIVETLLFASFLYWTGAYWMSRESQRLERRLGVGER